MSSLALGILVESSRSVIGNKVVGRFAPTPTSDFHLGNLRTALLAWLFARQAGGRFLLRIEDLDTQRIKNGLTVADQQLLGLEKLGFDWDGPVLYQSKRIEIYREIAKKLDWYECFCSRKEIAQAAQAPHDNFRAYPKTCANLTEAEKKTRRQSRQPAIRVRANNPSSQIFDLHFGQVSGLVDDFVLFRADGTPAYNLATVIDDGLTNVNQVTRGVDLLTSSPRQAWLAKNLGFVPPTYIHVGLGLSVTGKRLAKRDQDATLTDLVEAGLSYPKIFRQLCSLCGLPQTDTPTELLIALGDQDLTAVPQIWQNWVSPTIEQLTYQAAPDPA